MVMVRASVRVRVRVERVAPVLLRIEQTVDARVRVGVLDLARVRARARG